MKSLRAGVLAASLIFGSTFVLLAGFEMISLTALVVGVALLIVVVTVGLAISGAGKPQKPESSRWSLVD